MLDLADVMMAVQHVLLAFCLNLLWAVGDDETPRRGS